MEESTMQPMLRVRLSFRVAGICYFESQLAQKRHSVPAPTDHSTSRRVVSGS